nr:MAG TPA: hypothetical protein [Caudoviricetes sp.]
MGTICNQHECGCKTYHNVMDASIEILENMCQ